MVRARSVVPLTLCAAFMVLWLWTRMWFGTHPNVWAFSCMVGAWAPFVSAAIFLHVRAIASKQDSVFVAWLVRALAMHFVLAWMVGFSDWLRGPPNLPPAWNQDLTAPIALFSFAPAFVIAVGGVAWIHRVSRRLVEPLRRPAMPGESLDGAIPFRGVPFVLAGSPTARTTVAPFAVGFAALIATHHAVGLPIWVFIACALCLAVITVRNHRALIPSLATLAGVTLMALIRTEVRDLRAFVSVGVAWPWLTFACVAFYLAAMEALLFRARVPAAR